MDRLTAMRVFVKVVELGSFTRAADALELSRTMTTTHLARLEAHLGVRLLNRSTRRLSLTEAGAAYYERCGALLAEIESLEGSLEAMTEEPRGVLKISAPVSFGARHLAAALALYLERHPAVKLDVSLNDRTVDLVEEGYDLAIRITSLADSSLIARPIAATSMRLCASPGYVARHGAPAHPADLAAHDCLGYTYSGRGNLWAFEGADGPVEVRVKTETRANNGELLRLLALHGNGIVLLPGFMVAEDLAAGTLVELCPGFPVAELGIYAVYPSRKYLSAKVRTLVEFLVEHFGAGRRW